MINCKLKKNRNKSRCKVLRSIRNKKLMDLSWKEAKAKYPNLKSYGNADKDNHTNKKDCRPFNKKKHSLSITDSDGMTDLYISRGAMTALKYIQFAKDLGLPPSQTHKELKQKGITTEQQMEGAKAYQAMKRGTNVYVGGGGEDVASEGRIPYYTNY
jgi:hypothetical protein